jgi:hypothetical protein
MALTATTLVGNIDAHVTWIQVTSETGFVAKNVLRVDNELMGVQAVKGALIGVSRGIRGTKAVAHNALADAVTGPWTDFPIEMVPSPGSYTYSVSGALTVAPGVHKIIKPVSLAAMTLAAPTTAQEGIVMTIVSLSAYAHTVTYTAGFAGNTTSSDVATLDAIGHTLTILSVDGKWVILALYLTAVA